MTHVTPALEILYKQEGLNRKSNPLFIQFSFVSLKVAIPSCGRIPSQLFVFRFSEDVEIRHRFLKQSSKVGFRF